jgi:broad specificity phosphatase PhoE
MKVIFVRHGETLENRDNILQGQRHGTLSELGIMQAKAISETLKEMRIDIIYSSDLNRALDTAKEIAKYHASPLIPLKDLRERDIGVFAGMKREEVPKLDEYKQLGMRPPGGETIEEVYARLERFKNMLMERHNNASTILVVGHGTMGRVFNLVFSGKGISEIQSTSHLENTEINSFELSTNL